MGRPKGSRNKNTEEFRQRIRRYCETRGVDPFMYLVDVLKKQGVQHNLKIMAAKELCQYLEPKLRAVELSGNPEKPLFVLSPEARQQRIAELEARRHGKASERLALVDPE